MQFFRNLSTRIALTVILFFTMIAALPFYASAAQKKPFVVVIDAGHGGNDAGASENDVKEKDVNLAVALKLGELIKKKLKDTKVIYTRDNDVFISLQKRAEIANKANADLFISIHCNSVDRNNKNRSNVSGASTYILGHHKDNDNLAVARRENSVVELDAKDKAHFAQFDASQDESHIIFEMSQKQNFKNSARFAKAVQDEMANAGRFNRGVKQAGFWVLWSTAMPSALIELDFICNPNEAKFLKSKDGQEKLAGAIFNAVKSYEAFFRQNLGAQSKVVETEASDPPADAALAVVETKSEESPRRHRAQPETPLQPQLTDKEPADNQPATATRRRTRRNKAPGGDSSVQNQATTKKASEPETVEQDKDISQELTQVQNSDANETAILISESQNEAETTVELSKSKNLNKPSTKASRKESTAENNKKAKPSKEASSNAELASKESKEPSKQGGRRKAQKQKINKIYKILLFTSPKELDKSDSAFKGLENVARFKEEGKYYYTYGEGGTQEELQPVLEEIQELFPEARIIQRIS